MPTAIAQSRGNKAANMTEKDPNPLLVAVHDFLSKNGISEKDRLLFAFLEATYNKVESLPQRIERLENKSIVMWIEKHPKLSGVLAAVLSFVVMTIHEIYPRVLVWLSVVNPLKSIGK